MLEAIRKESLSDSIARAIKDMIDRKGFRPGDKLPPITEMAAQFEVGAPTLREALRQLQALGVIDMKHGSGVFVSDNCDALFVANPIRPTVPSRTTMLDLLDTRLMIETYTAGLAAGLASEDDLHEMEAHLAKAESALEKQQYEELRAANMSFHGIIAKASGNTVAHQILDLLTGLYRSEQYAILKIYGSPWKDLKEHREILNALRDRDPERATNLMHEHLDGVKQVLANFDGDIPGIPGFDT